MIYFFNRVNSINLLSDMLGWVWLEYTECILEVKCGLLSSKRNENEIYTKQFSCVNLLKL